MNSAVPIKQNRAGWLIGFAVFFTVGLIVLLGLGLMRNGAAPLANGSAPAFEIKSFEGQTYRLADLRGRPVVINFWASWCKECRDEAAFLEATWKQYREQGLIVIGVDYVDTEPEAKAYLAQFGITYPNGADLQTRISQAYHITGVPETYFITRDGKLLEGLDSKGRAYGNWIGPIPEASLSERVLRLLQN